MQKNTFFSLSFALVLALVMTACGGGESAEGGDLASKKAELANLKTERKAIDGKIKALQSEIEAMDSSTVRDSRVPVRTATVQESNFEHFVKVQGSIVANKSVIVSPQMGGIITKVYVKEGQQVRQGQLLAKIDDAVLQKSLLELETQLELADTVYRRQQKLWDQKIGSEIQLLQAKTQKESLERRIATTKEQVAMTNVKAPLSGTVDAAYAKAGEVAAPGLPSFNIINLGDLSFKADLSESYIPYVKKGDEVSIEFPSINKTIQAKVYTISKIINPVNRTVSIEVRLPSKEADFKANMIGEISIRDVFHENTVVIPVNYVQQSSSTEFVMVANRNESGQYFSKRIPISTGGSYEDKVEITSGLTKGMQLITEGATGLGDGVELLFLDNQ